MKFLFLTLLFNHCLLVFCSLTYQEKEENFKSELFVPVNQDSYRDDTCAPTVFIALFVRNKEHALPYFLNTLYNVNYPKRRMIIKIVTDHNRDNSSQILQLWIEKHQNEYHDVYFENTDNDKIYSSQTSDLDWPEERHVRMLRLRQEALDLARKRWADYILYIDADNLLLNPHFLWHLIDDDVIVVAPMLDSISSYSNFWCGQDERGYYVRTDDYFPIRNQEKKDVFEVPMIHSTFLIDLTKKKSASIQFWPLRDDYNLLLDDIIVFSKHAKSAGISLHVDNRFKYGYLPAPLSSRQSLKEEVETFLHLLMEVMTEPPVGIGIQVHPSPVISPSPPLSKLGFNEIYMINLVRRLDRFHRMNSILNLQGINYKHFPAIDSKQLNTSYLVSMGIDMLPGFVDPYHHRTALTRGEIGCFLSHYFIWKEVIEKDYSQVIVFEDDVRFENAFIRNLNAVMDEVNSLQLEWDLIYIGRKRMQTKVPEKRVEGSSLLVEADYSFWTLGYLLSKSGARKLLAGNPLGKMVPVDEYLPIMFNKHPIKKYKDAFPLRNVAAFSAEPLLIYPTHYTGQVNYFSDTETSTIWEENGKDEL